MLKKLIISSVLLLLSSLAVSAMQVPQHEKDALLALYDSTGGVNWWPPNSSISDPVDHGWRSSDSLSDVCAWHGVYCKCYYDGDCDGAEGETNVSRLSVPYNATGSLPESIGDLTELVWVNIDYTKVGGKLPKSVGNWTKLETLRISNSLFSGELPDEVLNWEKLNTLQISNNAFFTENNEVETFLTQVAHNGTYEEGFGIAPYQFHWTQALDVRNLRDTGRVIEMTDGTAKLEVTLTLEGSGYPIAFVSEREDGPFTQHIVDGGRGGVGQWENDDEKWYIPGLKPDTTYFIHVRSRVAVGYGAMSDGSRANQIRTYTDITEIAQGDPIYLEDITSDNAAVGSSGGGGGGSFGGAFLIFLTGVFFNRSLRFSS